MNNNHHLHSSLCKEIKEILSSNEQKKLFNQKKPNKSSSMKNITKPKKTRNRNNSSLIIANNTTSCSMCNNNNNNNIQNFAKLLLNQKPYDNVLLSTYYNCKNTNNNNNNVLMHMSYNNNINNNNNPTSAKMKHKNRSFLENVDDEQHHQKNFIARILSGYGSSTGKTHSNIMHSHKKTKSNNSSCNISNSMKCSNFLNTTREYTHKGSKSKLKEDLNEHDVNKEEFVSKKYRNKRKDKIKRINSCENEINKINSSNNHTHRKNSCYNNCTGCYRECSSVSSRNHKKQFTQQCFQYQMNNSNYNYQTNNNGSKRIISSTSSDKMKGVHNEFDWGALQSLEEYHFMFVKLITKQKKDLKQCDNCINNSNNTNLNINEFD